MPSGADLGRGGWAPPFRSAHCSDTNRPGRPWRVIRRELLNGLFVLVVASLLPEDEAATAVWLLVYRPLGETPPRRRRRTDEEEQVGYWIGAQVFNCA